MSLHRITIRYSELYFARKLAAEWITEIQQILERHDRWYKPKLDPEKRTHLEKDEQMLLSIIGKIDKHFLENADLINYQCDPDYILP